MILIDRLVHEETEDSGNIENQRERIHYFELTEEEIKEEIMYCFLDEDNDEWIVATDRDREDMLPNNTNFLDDDWEVSGTDIISFTNAIYEVAGYSFHAQIRLPDNIIMHCYDGDNDCYDINVKNVLPKGRLRQRKEDPFAELEHTSQKNCHRQLTESGFGLSFIMPPPDVFEEPVIIRFIVSKLALPSFCQRVGFSSHDMNLRSLASSCMMAEYIGRYDKSANLTLVLKFTQDTAKTKKIFAVLTSFYEDVPLCIISRMADALEDTKLGKPVCREWRINHIFSYIDLSFPEYAEKIKKKYQLPDGLMPCVRLKTSDTGNSATMAAAYWLTDSGAVIWEEKAYERKHKNRIDVCKPDEVCDEMKKCLKGVFDRLPKRLSELSKICVTQEGEALRDSTSISRNADIVSKIYISVLNECGVGYILGKKRLQILNAALNAVISGDNETHETEAAETIKAGIIDGSRQYTAYTLLMEALRLPETVGVMCPEYPLSADAIERLRVVLSKAPYAKALERSSISKTAGKAIKLEM